MYLVRSQVNGNLEYEFYMDFKKAKFKYDTYCDSAYCDLAYDECYDGILDMENCVELIELYEEWVYDELTKSEDELNHSTICKNETIESSEEGYVFEWKETCK